MNPSKLTIVAATLLAAAATTTWADVTPDQRAMKLASGPGRLSWAPQMLQPHPPRSPPA